jgi:hypothetical protein
MNKEELKARTKRFALRVMTLVEALPMAASRISAARVKKSAIANRKSEIS